MYSILISVLLLLSNTLLLLSSTQAAEQDEDLGLSEPWRITDDNFNDIINSTSHLIVFAYVNWCGHCKSFAPEWTKIATKLNTVTDFKTKAYSALIEENTKIHNEWDLTSFPAIVYVRNGHVKRFGDSRKEEVLLDFVRKLEADPTVEIEAGDIEEFVSVSDVSVVGLFKTRQDVERMNTLSWELQLPAAAVVFDTTLTPGVTVYSSLEGRPRNATKTDLSDWEKVKKFVSLRRRPLVLPFNKDNQKIPFELSSVTTSVLLFHDDSKEGYNNRLDIMGKIGRSYGRSHNIIEMNMADEYVQRFSAFFKLKSSDLPVVYVIDTAKENKNKGKMATTKDITEEGIAQLIEDYRAGSSVTVSPQERGAEENEPDKLPEDWDTRDIKYLNKDNYLKYVLDGEMNVFVMIYRDSCPHCQNLKPIWTELANKYVGSATVKIAQMKSNNVGKIEGLTVEYVPTLILYTTTARTISHGIVFKEKSNKLPDLEQFLQDNVDKSHNSSSSKEEL